MRLRHPDLPDNDPIDIPDEPSTIAVHEAGGWVPVEEEPAAEPEVVEPEPEVPIDDLRAELVSLGLNPVPDRWRRPRLLREIEARQSPVDEEAVTDGEPEE